MEIAPYFKFSYRAEWKDMGQIFEPSGLDET